MKVPALLVLQFGLVAVACDDSSAGPDASPGAAATLGDIAEALAEHVAVEDAHHAKTTSADELVSGTLDPARLSNVPHDCVWARDASTSNTALRRADCPGGKHPISGSCISNNIGIAIVSSQPTSGGLVLSANAVFADADDWTCIFDGAATDHIALALCCSN